MQFFARKSLESHLLFNSDSRRRLLFLSIEGKLLAMARGRSFLFLLQREGSEEESLSSCLLEGGKGDVLSQVVAGTFDELPRGKVVRRKSAKVCLFPPSPSFLKEKEGVRVVDVFSFFGWTRSGLRSWKSLGMTGSLLEVMRAFKQDAVEAYSRVRKKKGNRGVVFLHR